MSTIQDLIRLDPRRFTTEFIGHSIFYNKKANDLLAAYITFFTSIVQDEKCLRGKRISDSFRDLLCQTSLRYAPLPDEAQKQALSSQLQANPQLAKGTFGYIISWDHSVDSILKVPLTLDHDSNLCEMIVTYVVINTLLLHHRSLQPHLVKTYGVFSSALSTFHPDLSIRDQLPSFGSWGTDVKPTLYMIQERIHGMSLHSYVAQPEFTLDICRRILKQVWSILIALSSSPYQLYHNDLHSENIMVKPDGNIVILDWGLSRFTLNGITYDSSHLRQYTDYSYATGAPDCYRLIKSILQSISLTNPERSALYDYLFSISERLCIHFYEETNVDDSFWLATLSEKRKREAVKKEHQEMYQKRINELRVTFGNDEARFEDELYRLQHQMFAVLLEADEEQESLNEIWPPKHAIEFVKDGVFRSLSSDDIMYGFRLRKKSPEYKDGIPTIHETEYMLFPPQGHRNLFGFLHDLEKHTSSGERRSELHALHRLQLERMTYEFLGERVLQMSKEEIDEAKQLTQNDEPMESGKKKKRTSIKKKSKKLN